jgi:hypothetical protein
MHRKFKSKGIENTPWIDAKLIKIKWWSYVNFRQGRFQSRKLSGIKKDKDR